MAPPFAHNHTHEKGSRHEPPRVHRLPRPPAGRRGVRLHVARDSDTLDFPAPLTGDGWSLSKKLGKTTRLDVSGSGASVSKRIGPFTISSRGNLGVRLGKGVGIRKKLW